MRAYDGLDVKLLASGLLPGCLQGADGDAEVPVRKAAIEGQALIDFDFGCQGSCATGNLSALGSDLIPAAL